MAQNEEPLDSMTSNSGVSATEDLHNPAVRQVAAKEPTAAAPAGGKGEAAAYFCVSGHARVDASLVCCVSFPSLTVSFFL